MQLSVRQIRNGMKRFGLFRKPGKGNADGHSQWVNADGFSVNPQLRDKSYHISQLRPLIKILESHGICSKQDFIKSCIAG